MWDFIDSLLIYLLPLSLLSLVGCVLSDIFYKIKKFILTKKGKLLMRQFKIKYLIGGKRYERVLKDTSLIRCLNEFLERYPEVHVLECEEIN